MQKANLKDQNSSFKVELTKDKILNLRIKKNYIILEI